jgi:hypothetical protein
MAPTSSAVAGRVTASGPITRRRMAEWPTMNPRLIAGVPSMRSRYSAVVVQSPGTPAWRAGSGIPSTTASIRTR